MFPFQGNSVVGDINDVTHLTLSDGSMTPFADDIMIYRPIRTPQDLVMLQSDIDSLIHLGLIRIFCSSMQTNVSTW